MILQIEYFYQLPTPARALICQDTKTPHIHSGYLYPLQWVADGRLARCEHCRKFRIHNLHECVECGDYFVKDFSHPAWCPIGPKTCWYCTEALELLPCECISKHPPVAECRRPPLKPKVVLDPNFDPFKISFK